MLPTTTNLSPEDRNKLSLLFRTRGDAVSMASLREEDPLETLAWLEQPHIKPWHQAIQKAHREHEATETHLSLARALKDITRILDLEADSTLRIRAVNAVIRLANAIHRSNPAAPRTAPPKSAAGNHKPSTSTTPPNLRADDTPAAPPITPMPPLSPISQELRAANVRAQDSLIALDLHLDRRARLNHHLKEADAPIEDPRPSPAAPKEPVRNSAAVNHTAPDHHATPNHPAANGRAHPRSHLPPPSPSGHARRSPRPPTAPKSHDPKRRRPRAP